MLLLFLSLLQYSLLCYTKTAKLSVQFHKQYWNSKYDGQIKIILWEEKGVGQVRVPGSFYNCNEKCNFTTAPATGPGTVTNNVYSQESIHLIAYKSFRYRTCTSWGIMAHYLVILL